MSMKNYGKCAVCKKPLILPRTKGRPKTHPGDCRLEYYSRKGYVKYRGLRTPKVAFHRFKDEPTDAERKALGLRVPRSGKVKCLGPREPEHYFHSEDVTKIRMCESCREYLENQPAMDVNIEAYHNASRGFRYSPKKRAA